jgi:hypothetical protein
VSDYLNFSRLPILLLVIFMIARFILGASGVPYEQGTWLFSMVTLTFFAAFFYGAFSRRLRGYKWYQGMLLGVTIAIVAQILILLATLASYLVGAETYFNHPTALNVEEAVGLGQALVSRVFGLIANSISAGICGCLGWLGGKLIPETT